MRQWLRERTDHHLRMLEKAVQMGNDILSAVHKQDYELMLNICDNRDRLIQIVSQLQGEIECSIQNLSASSIDRPLVMMLQHWQKRTQERIQSILSNDESIVSLLESEKEETTREIAQLFRAKQSLKGYNLNDVSR